MDTFLIYLTQKNSFHIGLLLRPQIKKDVKSTVELLES